MNETEIYVRLIATAIFTENSEIRDSVFSMDDEIFPDEINEIFTTFRNVYKKNQNADYEIFINKIENENLKSAFLTALVNVAVKPKISDEQVPDTIKAIKKDYAEKQFKNKLETVQLKGPYFRKDIAKIVEETEPIESISLNTIDKYIAEYGKVQEFVPTGFENLDANLTGGFLNGTMISIGARPSTGKTTFAINIANFNRTKKTLFFSLEMSAAMIYDRLLADTLNFDYGLTGKHKINIDTVRNTLVNHYQNLSVIDNVSNIENITELVTEAKPQLVIIDYVQIIQSDKKHTDNRQRIDYISQRLKQTAKKNKCCIIILSQITRNGKDRPTMSDLKESGGLEQDSDYIMLLHRPYVNDKNNMEISPEETTVILDKNKFGRTCELKYKFDGSHQRFTEITDDNSIAHMKPAQEISAGDDLPF